MKDIAVKVLWELAMIFDESFKQHTKETKMQKQFIKMFLSTLSGDAMKDIAVTVLWELAKMTDNKVDDKIVKTVAEALGVELED